MNRKYVMHPGDYAIGENEKLYADLAGAGWFLVKRGAYLSRFQKGTPEARLYRIELSSPDLLDEDTALPDEQVSLYEECGWRFVTRSGLIHVFTAPARSGAPEFYSDPRQQAATLKALRRSYILGWIPAVLVFLFQFLIAASLSGSTQNALGRLAVELKLGCIRQTALFGLCAAAVLLSLCHLIYGAARTTLLYRRLKKGRALDHAPTKKRRAYRAVTAVLWTACALFALLFALQWAGYEKYDMPPAADGPYLTLGDLGVEGARGSVYYPDKASSVETSRSLLARQWDTYEGIGRAWIYQDVFRFSNERLAREAAPLLMRSATFARTASDFQAVRVPGLDLAYHGGMEYVAVRGNTVWYITLLLPGEETGAQRAQSVFAALAALQVP